LHSSVMPFQPKCTEVFPNHSPGLYGIVHSNRNFSDPYYWGKNQFNSSFPVALACYMRDQQHKASYIKLSQHGVPEIDELSFSEVFGSEQPNEDLHFSFESQYAPFQEILEDHLVPIDLVVMSNQLVPIRPLEIKLTTLPDDSTSRLASDRQGTEIVVRSPTLKYLALSIATGLGALGLREEINKMLQVFARVRDWNNLAEARRLLTDATVLLNEITSTYQSAQCPLLMQPIWKTVGKSAVLAENCLDIFVWSDYALTKLFVGEAGAPDNEAITRPQRATLRLIRFLYEWSRGTKVYQAPIFDGMTYDTLNDKEFSVSGRKTNTFMACARLKEPIIAKHEIKRIILGGGQNFLSPERRFDAIIYFSSSLFSES
jgi:HindVP restriction endonuclease